MADGYEVTDVFQRDRFTTGGKKVTYYDVGIVTERGASGTLRIKAVDYEPQTIKQKLDEFAKKLDTPFLV